VRITDAGVRLLPRARELLSIRADTLQVLADEDPSGTVRVSASTIPATYLLPPVLARLREHGPAIDVRVAVSDSMTARRALLDGDCDLALFGTRPDDPRIVARVFGEDRIVLVGPADQPAPQDLQGMPLVLRGPDSGTRRAVEHLLPPEGPRIEVGSTEAARRCVLAGLGLGLLSHLAVEEDLKAGRLVAHALRGTPVRRTFFAGRLRARTPSRAARGLWRQLVR
jgi:DNA-binding transcriptional LysR family regulator